MALVPNQEIEMVWCGKNRKHYESLGYVYTGLFDKFTIKAEELSNQSNRKVAVTCDYCGKVHYITNAKHNKFGDTCVDCSPLKVKETNMKLYGVDNAFKREDVKDKIKKTCLEKYGVDNPKKSEEIKEKGIQTCLEKYGVENPGQSQEIKEKIKKTFIDKYGVPSCLLVPEVRQKCRNTVYQNGTAKISKGENATVELLKELYGEENCIPQYPTTYYNFDCLVINNGVKIDVEYDGIYSHKARASFDKERDDFHISKGYKVLRIKADKSVPTKEQLSEAIKFLTENSDNYYEIILEKIR